MPLQKIIIHELSKEQGINVATVFIADACLDIAKRTQDLDQKLLEAFNTEYQNYAVFEEGDGSLFPQRFADYLDSAQENQNFRTFTEEVMQDLRTRIEAVNLATGGYLVFTEYQTQVATHLCVFLVRNTNDLVFRRVGLNFDILDVTHLDTKKLSMACRININKYNAFPNTNENYLAFIGRRQPEVSAYFYRWIGVAERTSTQQLSELFRREVINQIELPIDPDTGETFTRDNFKQRSYEYIRALGNRAFNIFSFSEHFFDDRDHVPQYIHQAHLPIDSEFRYAKPELNKLRQVEVQYRSLKLKFSLVDWETGTVSIGQDNPDRIIIDSANLANRLRTEIDEQ